MPELTVASTTDTDADVKRAANVPIAPEPEVEVEKEPDQQQSSDAQEPQEEQHEQKPAKSAFQKRIDRLTRERSEAERRAEAAERRAQAAEESRRALETPEAEAQEPPQVQEQSQPSRERPKPEDVDDKGQPKYKTYEDFVEDLTDWKMEQKELAKAQQEAKQAWEEQRQEVVSAYNRNVTDFKKDHPDFDRIVNQDILVPQVALDTAFELGNPGIAYYLGQHPEICKELRDNVTRPGWVAARIGQIDTLTASAQPESEEESEAPLTPRRSAAPPPIKPVGGSSTKSSVPLEDMPYSEYRKIRDRQVKERYRR